MEIEWKANIWRTQVFLQELADNPIKKTAATKGADGTRKRKTTATIGLDLAPASKKKKDIATPLQKMVYQFPALGSLVTQVQSLSKLVVSLKKEVKELKKEVYWYKKKEPVDDN